MKRCLLLLVVLCTVVAELGGCGDRLAPVKEHAQEVADAFADGNSEAIERVVFGTGELEVDDELADVWGTGAPSSDGVLDRVFELVSIEVIDVTDSAIEYEVEAPDMSGVFAAVDVNSTDLTADKLLEHITSYAQGAVRRKTTVSLEYVMADGKPRVNYQDEVFVNAITGGLLDAYKNLYSEMLSEYAKNVSQS